MLGNVNSDPRLIYKTASHADVHLVLALAGSGLSSAKALIRVVGSKCDDQMLSTVFKTSVLTISHKPNIQAYIIIGFLRCPRLQHIRNLDLRSDRAKLNHQNRLLQLAREGAATTTQHLARFDDPRRYGTLVAVLLEASSTLTDDYTWQAAGRLRKGAFRPLRPFAASNE